MAIPLGVAAGLGLISTIGGMVQTLGGEEKQREAEKASAKFAADIRQRLLERTVGKQALPMRGFDLAKEGLAQRYATGVSALQSAGAEGVLGGLGGLMQQQTEAERALAAQIEKMEYARDLEYQRRLDRERDLKYQTLSHLDFMGLKGSQEKADWERRRKQAGMQNIIGGLGTAAELGLKYAPLYRKTGGATASGDMIDIGGDTSQISRVGRQAPITPQEQYIQMRQGDTGNVMDTSALVPGATATDFYGQHSRFPKINTTGAPIIGGFGNTMGIDALSATGHLTGTAFNPGGYVPPMLQAPQTFQPWHYDY